MSRIAIVTTFSTWWYYLKYWPKYNCSNCPFPLCQPYNQFGFFTRKVTSGMCISTTRDPSTESVQNSFFMRHMVLCIQKLRNLCHTSSAVLVFQSCKTAFFVSLAHLSNSCESNNEFRHRSYIKCLSLNILSFKEKNKPWMSVCGVEDIFSRK